MACRMTDDALMVDQGCALRLTVNDMFDKHFNTCLGGGIGRRKGLKIPRS